MVKWTPEQQDAIYMRGSDILVSAAAGSGKTAVLVERIIERLLDENNLINIDEILVVTFTNAAAAEMKSRIGKALEDALTQFPDSIHLKKQLSLLPRAQISTLHAFYTRVVRQYAYLFDLDPAFKIADEIENDLIKQDVIDDLFEHYYSEEDDLERFFAVVDRYSSDRSDVDVESLLLDLYEFAMQNPSPELWLNELAETYNIPDEFNEEKIEWLTILKNEINDLLFSFKNDINRALLLTEDGDGPYHYAEALEADLLLIDEAEKSLHSWDELQSVFLNSKRKTLSRKKVECDPYKSEKVKQLRKRYTDGWDRVKKRWFTRHLIAHIEDMRELYPVIQMIVELVKQFRERFTRIKREQALVDFLDLEHLCLDVFTDKIEANQTFKPSDIALNYKKQFKEILIDEYQDINYVQETILSLISDHDNDGNRFMVGDVKQSVYRFRHAEPKLFIEKYEQFSTEQSKGGRIDLAKNFRSRENVLVAANYLFRQIFDIELGEIAYDVNAELVFGNESYNDNPLKDDHAELILIDCDTEGMSDQTNAQIQQFEELDKSQLEARIYVKKIKEWLGHDDEPPLQVIDKVTGKQRNVRYSDIAILHRSLTWAQTIVQELTDANIPIYAELRDGYFEAIEIQVMINFLKIIDNPYQDIPLASVLKSPIIQINEEQLMKIRLVENRKSLFDALKKYEKTNSDQLSQTLFSFLTTLNSFRALAKEGALSELIWQIYQETGYFDFVGGMPGGRQRQANLRALYDRARTYESTSFRGLFRFLRFIERMEEENKDLGAARALSEEEDVVKLMTIHKSKGLEFPIVIVGGMNREFNFQDLNKKYLLDKDYGFATKYIDPIKQINYPTLYYHSIREEMLQKQLAEEMRVLYVALTRAKEKVVMIGTVNSAEKTCEKWQEVIEHEDWVLPKQLRKRARTFLDWVGPALVRHETNKVLNNENISINIPTEIRTDSSRWTIFIVPSHELVQYSEEEKKSYDTFLSAVTKWEPIEQQTEEQMNFVEQRLNYNYPFVEATMTRAKQSVTEIKRTREIVDEYSANNFVQAPQSKISQRPAFMQTEKRLTASEIGSAIHTVMQHLPLTRVLSREEIGNYIGSFVDRDILRDEEMEIIDINIIEQFYQTELAQYIMKSDMIEKEVPFTYTLNTSDVYIDWESKEEKVLIQGVIDLLIHNEDGWSIIDYKTDTIVEDVITEEVVNKLKQRYVVQVGLYKQAVESIIKEPIRHVYLHFLNRQLTIEL